MDTRGPAGEACDLESIPCDYCGSGENSLVMTLEGWQIVRCSQCGLLYVNPRPRPEHILQWYQGDVPDDKGGSKWYEQFYGEKFDIDKGLFAEYLSRIRRYKTSGRFLDVGCGNGASLFVAREAGFDAYGVEIGEWAQEKASLYGLRIIKGTLESAAFPDRYFDVVFSKSFLEHVHSPLAMLKEMCRVLKDDGILVCAGVPNFDSFTIKLGRDLFSGNVPPAHLYYFQTRTLMRTVERAGFRCAEARSWGLPNDFLAGLLRRDISRRPVMPSAAVAPPRKGVKALAYRWGRATFNALLNLFKVGAITDIYAWKKV